MPQPFAPILFGAVAVVLVGGYVALMNTADTVLSW